MNIISNRASILVYRALSFKYRYRSMMECFLMCSERSHEPINLPDGQPVVVGRSVATKIREKKVSRNQVELTADYGTQRVMVKQFLTYSEVQTMCADNDTAPLSPLFHLLKLGSNPSSIGSIVLSQNDTRTLGAGGKLNLLRDKYEHFIYFKQQDTSVEQDDMKGSENSDQKRKCESLEDNNGPAKRQKIENVKSLASKSTSRLRTEDGDDYEDLRKEFGANIDEQIKNSQNFANEKLVSSVNEEEGKEFVDFKPTTSRQWEEIDGGKLLMCKTEGLLPRKKIAGLDLDGTLITTKSGKVYATGPEDWKIKMSASLQKVKSLHEDGFKIVIFTNQGSIGRGRLSKEDFRKKIDKIALTLQVPFQLFAATDYGIYRKPLNGMWKHLVEKENCGLSVDVASSFYVGDAAGRPVNWAPKEKKDFACSDRTFSENIGIRFFTPEEFFLTKKPAPFSWPQFNPKSLPTDGPMFTPPTAKLIADKQEVVILVGYPASGKTSFVKKHLLSKGYVHINRDKCGSWQKCVAMCKTALSHKNSVVIDNTSPDKESRKRYIQPAKKANVPVRCFLFDVSYEHALHNNTIREIVTTDKNYKRVGKMVFNTYRSSYQEPTLSEGFTEILKINFIPKFESLEFKNLYMQYSGA